MTTRAIIAPLAFCPMLALAEPVYLQCQLNVGGAQPLKFQLALDESTRKITHTKSDGSAFNAEGFFSANTISYQQISGGRMVKMTERYEINRTDLTVRRTLQIESTVTESREPPVDNGACELVKLADRKI